MTRLECEKILKDGLTCKEGEYIYFWNIRVSDYIVYHGLSKENIIDGILYFYSGGERWVDGETEKVCKNVLCIVNREEKINKILISNLYAQ
jgi:hypothetical protein